LWQHFHLAIELCLAVKQRKGFRNKIQILFAKPEKIDPALRGEAERIFNIHQNPVLIDRPLNRYVIWQMIILLSGLSLFILFEHYLSLPVKSGFAIVVILTLINCGAIMEQK